MFQKNSKINGEKPVYKQSCAALIHLIYNECHVTIVTRTPIAEHSTLQL